MADKDYSVVISRRHDGFTKEEAIQFALTYRKRGYGANVYPQDEALRLFDRDQQDLTKLMV